MKTLQQTIPDIKSLASAVGLAAVLALSSRNAIAQATIANVYPNGTNLFQPSPTLSFTANSAAGVTNVTVNLTVTSLYTGSSYLKVLTAASGLTITGPSTSESVSAVLASNTVYSALIQIQDGNGAVASQTVVFDTIRPVYTWEAVDWDYTDTNTSVSGLFFDNPQTNHYAGLASTGGVDYNNPNAGASNDGNANYRPQGLETEGCGDVPRLAYLPPSTNGDYDVGYDNNGNWGNYTRHYPAGTYNVFVRASDGNGAQANAGDISVVAGTASFANTGPYYFSVKSTGWQTYGWYPVIDTNSPNNLAVLTIPNDGTASTLRETIDGGNCNTHFFMLVPINTNIAGTTVTISNLYPNGLTQFQWTNVLSFTAQSPVGINASDVTIQLAITNLYGVGYVTNLTTANGLTVTGPSTAVTVTAPLTNNMVYTAFIQVNDGNGIPASDNVTFDTINPVYTFEAEDYNYNSGLFFDNPQTNAYFGQFGTPGVDYSVDDPLSGSHTYRDNDPTVGGPATEGCGDVPRAAYTNGTSFADYDVGFNDSANWENYTRTFPAGTYNILLRGANGGGGTGSASMGLVTTPVPVNTASQTVSPLGSFAVPSTGNWQKYVFAPLKDINGNLVSVTFDGTPQTLRVSAPNSMNANFYMLVPPNPATVTVSNLYPNGTALFQRTNTLSFVASSAGGIATSNIIVTLNGTVLSNLTLSGSSTSWTVSYPNLQPDQTYSATIAITSIAGGVYNLSFTFDTYSPNYYEWESSDYDYTSNGISGQFFDNPQTNAYNQLGATSGTDELEVTASTPLSEDLYRTNQDGSLLVTTQPGGDLFRAKFATLPSWRINWFGYGDFCNYTRHYPAGTYKIVGRFTEGGAASSAQLVKIESGSTNVLGSFNIPLSGWNGWEFATLVGTNGNPVSVTLDGNQTILQLTGPASNDGQTINAGFFMLVPFSSTPPITITPSLSGGQIKLSFPTVTGHNYQVEYRTNLTDVGWTALGSPIPGNNAVQVVQDPATAGHRFYHVHVE